MTAFKPEPRPRVLKTTIKGIADYVAKRVAGMGFNVYVAFSKKSKSRYLELYLRDGYKVIVRIADHPADRKNRWRYRFDIHTVTPRHGSMDYIEFIDTFKQIVGRGGR